jgi:hypothetical protein
MCIVSNIGDSIGSYPWKDPNSEPWVWPTTDKTTSPIVNIPDAPDMPALDSDSELIGLQVKAVKEWLLKIDKILIAARDFDEATGQPDCETDEKMAKLKELADAFGVDMKFFS